MWTPANTSLAWWTAALWLHSPHSAPELGESFADHRGHQAYKSGLKKSRPWYHQRTEANVLSPVWEIFYLFPLADSGEWELYLFHLLMCLKHTLFFSYTCSNCRAMAGPRKSEGLCWDTLLASQTARFVMLCSISHPHGPLTHQACQLVEVSPLRWGGCYPCNKNWAVCRWWDWEKRSRRFPYKWIREPGGSQQGSRYQEGIAFPGSSAQSAQSHLCFPVQSNKCLTTIPVSCR